MASLISEVFLEIVPPEPGALNKLLLLGQALQHVHQSLHLFQLLQVVLHTPG